MMDAQDVIRAFCLLQEKVAREVHGYNYAADCFCGESGFWQTEHYDGTFEKGYRNDGKSLEFIKQAVDEKIERERRTA